MSSQPSIKSLTSPLFLTGVAVGGLVVAAIASGACFSTCNPKNHGGPNKPRAVGVSASNTEGTRFSNPVREKFKEEQLLQTVVERATQNDPDSVLDVIDHFGWNDTWFMNVGDVKGKILDDAIRARQPKVVLELGAYCGYSATRIGRLLPPGARLISIELDSLHAAIATKVVEWAGLADKVTIVIGTLETRVQYLQQKLGIKNFDLVFLDHHKDAYLSDLKLLEQSQLIVKGSVLVADNVIYPGAPRYLEYVRSQPSVYHNVFHESLLEYTTDKKDGIEVSTRLA